MCIATPGQKLGLLNQLVEYWWRALNQYNGNDTETLDDIME